MDIAATAVTATTLGIGYLGYSYIRKHWKIEVNCWFCNEDTTVELQNKNDFVCPHCEQYNGFNSSGDYAKRIDHYESVYKRYCVPQRKSTFSNSTPSNNGLCNICNTKQAIIVQKLANFEPINEEKFNEEYDTYKYKLDQMYPLCSECSIKAHQKFQNDKAAYGYLLDLKYKLFPVIKSSLMQAGTLTAKLMKRRRRRFFSGGTITVFGQCISLFLSIYMFAAYFNFLQEDTNVIFLPLPTMLRHGLSYATDFSFYIALVILFVHFLAMANNECRANFPDLLHPCLVGLHLLTYMVSDVKYREELFLSRCGVSALFSIMALIVLVVPRKRLHKSKPNRVLSSAFSVASTPVSQCSSQNVTMCNRSFLQEISSKPTSPSSVSSRLTKQSVRQRYQWRERESSPDPTPQRRTLFNDEMDWEPSPAPSIISLSTVHRKTREGTPSRALASTLSSMSIGGTKRRSNALSEINAPSTISESASRMKSAPCICILFSIFQVGTADPISLAIGVNTSRLLHASNFFKEKMLDLADITGGAVLLAGTGLLKFRDEIRCKLYECCQEPYVQPNFYNMKTALEKNIFGQHLVVDTVWNAVVAHWKSPSPKKPLVMSFHGYTGTGKNYVSRQIVENLYKNGVKSSFVHQIVATSEFPDKSRMEEYQLALRERILNGARKCKRSIFIFDEIDKMPEQLLSSIKPFLDYYDSVLEVDFRRSIFVFLSNQGGTAIANIAKDHHIAGNNREDLTLKHFEGPVMKEAFNKEGGLKMSELIISQLIDHFVPFLPLERQHVIMCTEDYLRARGRSDLASEPEFVNKIVDSLEYFPKGTPVFSSSGCKRIAQKAELELNKRGPLHSLDHNDEL